MIPPVPGIFRRRIILDDDGQVVRAGVEDDFHHFEVDLNHAGGLVMDIAGRAVRHPWATCPGAVLMLRQFIGVPVGTDAVRRRDLPPPGRHCTHMHDLTVLALAQAGRGPGRRVYDVAVPDRAGRTRFPRFDAAGIIVRPPDGPDGTTEPTLIRDGVPLLHWAMDGEHLTAPAEVAGMDFRKLGQWAATAGDDDFLEAVKVLRQGIFVSGGRVLPLDLVPGAAFQGVPAGTCYAFQAERMEQGSRMLGSTRDFTDSPGRPLAQFGEKHEP